MDVIKLKFINESHNPLNDLKVVMFQKNAATSLGELAVAWHVIRYCGTGCYHPFDFPGTTEVSASDSYGNFTPHLQAGLGDAFDMQLNPSGDQLVPSGTRASSPEEIEVRNNLATGSINANIFKDGKLLAAKTNVVPNQKAVFKFKPSLFIGTAVQVVQGKAMNSAVISQINTELSLLGLASADIVMTGGGGGNAANPYQFHLENAVLL